jgi:hypothetical protein
MLSPSTIENILNQLTSGQIKSLIGLDNTYVESGHENFEGMKAWVNKLTSIPPWSDSMTPNTIHLKKRSYVLVNPKNK